jgi:hypothetical protein
MSEKITQYAKRVEESWNNKLLELEAMRHKQKGFRL